MPERAAGRVVEGRGRPIANRAHARVLRGLPEHDAAKIRCRAACHPAVGKRGHLLTSAPMALTQPIGLSEPERRQRRCGDASTHGRVTPVMEQYIEIKAANPDCLLFYRMGDFYEMFFEDAEIASRALGIVLTKRGKHLGQDMPMCGVPVVRADEYLHRLIALGHRVAVCEQLEDPAEARKRGSKSVVRRDVVRLVTPGTLTEDTLLDAKRNNYLLAVARARLVLRRRGRALRARLDRYLDRRIPHHRMRPRCRSPPRSRGSSRARSSSPTRCTATPIWRPIGARCRR